MLFSFSGQKNRYVRFVKVFSKNTSRAIARSGDFLKNRRLDLDKPEKT